MLSHLQVLGVRERLDRKRLGLLAALSGPPVGVERVGVPLAESSYFATFADSSCCVALSASVLALSAKKIQKVTIKFALFQQVQLF